MIGTYDDLALEYYDVERHPTCANFREASRLLLKTWLLSHDQTGRTIVEVGAGMSLVAEVLAGEGKPLDSLILLDSSPRMLEHSHAWFVRGAHRKIASAEDMQLHGESIDTVVSVLGDPYNTAPFWTQVASILKPGGVVILTTPSFEWASAFRSRETVEKQHTAEFQLKDGRRISVPSIVLREAEQVAVMRQHGLRVIETKDVPLSAIGSALLSQKLRVLESVERPVATGYVARKESSAA